MKYCKKCGKEMNDNDQFCPSCGANQESGSSVVVHADEVNQEVSGKSRAVAAVLAFLLGSLGIHNFYLGKNKYGVIQLVCTLCFFLVIPVIISSIWALVDFILILCGTYTDGEDKPVKSWGGNE